MRVLLVFLLFALSAPAQQAKPNFSGKWALDLGKSNLDVNTTGIVRVDHIQHNEPKLVHEITAKLPQGRHASRVVYTTDGKSNVNRLGKQNVTSTTRWDGNKLVTVSHLQDKGTTVETKETWELSANGKVLTVEREMKLPTRTVQHRLVFNKR